MLRIESATDEESRMTARMHGLPRCEKQHPHMHKFTREQGTAGSRGPGTRGSNQVFSQSESHGHKAGIESAAHIVHISNLVLSFLLLSHLSRRCITYTACMILSQTKLEALAGVLLQRFQRLSQDTSVQLTFPLPCLAGISIDSPAVRGGSTKEKLYQRIEDLQALLQSKEKEIEWMAEETLRKEELNMMKVRTSPSTTNSDTGSDSATKKCVNNVVC